jgi:hypothetical protein
MTQPATSIDNWKFLSGARYNTEALDDHTVTATPYLAYGTTWDTTTPSHAAQNPAKWPTPQSIKTSPKDIALFLCFAVSDADNEEMAGTLWTRHGEGPAFDLLTFNPIRAGTAVMEDDITTQQPLSHLAFTSGSLELVKGDKLTGASSAATATVNRIHRTAGTWAGGDQAGTIYVDDADGTFQAAEELNVHKVVLSFDSGSRQWTQGDRIKGATSGAFGRVTGINLISGRYNNGDARGTITITITSGTFERENLDVGASLNVATIADPAFGAIATNGGALQYFRFADIVTASVDRTGATVYINGLANGLAIVGPIDLKGASHFWFDWDTNLAGGTDGVDGLCYYHTLA